jgi:hypothetical protein
LEEAPPIFQQLRRELVSDEIVHAY